MGSENLHEPAELLSDATKDMHRAIVSLMEELEAIDWYQQRAEVCADDELRAVLLHNKHEEIEHAMMNLEWIRRNSVEFDANVKTYLNSTGPITEVEDAATNGANGDGNGDDANGAAGRATRAPGREASHAGEATQTCGGGSLGIGSLKGT